MVVCIYQNKKKFKVFFGEIITTSNPFCEIHSAKFWMHGTESPGGRSTPGLCVKKWNYQRVLGCA
jgi:hypothetical protein